MVVAVVSPNSSESSDRALVRACLRGETQPFGHLYRRYQYQVRSTLFQLCGEEHLDDLVQDVFLRAWKGLPGFKHSAKFSTWLYRITWNVASDRRRDYAKRRERFQTAVANLPTESNRRSQLTQLHYQDLVQQGLAQLSLEHRTVLVLHDLEDLPQKEVAEILDVPIGTVKSRLHHARAGIRQFLQARGIEL
ncbi:MAG: sigma-70 family RNA polymerase sigma factor [Cyanobacteria bacterium P01_E01_bin.48]